MSDVTLGPENGIDGVLVFANASAISPGTTLTLDAALTVKWIVSSTSYFTIDGTLRLLGTLGKPVVITSITDDDRANLAYSLGAEPPRSRPYGPAPCEGRHCSMHPMAAPQARGASSRRSPMFTRTRIVSARTLVAFSALLLASGTAGAQTTISGNVYDGNGGPLLSGQVYHAVGTVTVPAGQTLTVQAGAIVKSNAAFFSVSGDLVVSGTSGSPVVFTSIRDDSAGGDTNGDGPSVGVPGDWFGIAPGATGSIDVLHAAIRFGGRNGLAAVFGQGGGITLLLTEVSHCAVSGMDLNGIRADVHVEGSTFLDNGYYAVQEAAIDTVPGFLDNTAAGNGLGDYLLVTDTSPAADVSVGPANGFGGVLVFAAGGSTIPAGVTLTLDPGLIVKWQVASTSYFAVQGTLRMLGTDPSPVVLTSITDDDHGGDTNKDGRSYGSPGQWVGVIVGSGGTLDASHAVIRYTGWNGFSAVFGQGGAITLRSSTLSESSVSGMDLNGIDTDVHVEGCSFVGNGAYAAQEVTVDSLPGFLDNTAAGNGLGNTFLVTDTSPAGDVAIGPRNGIGGVVVFAAGGSTIAAGRRLTLEPGLIVKWQVGSTSFFSVEGRLELLGTDSAPAVLTSITDDEHGGDTNRDGPSSGAPGQWVGIIVQDGGALVGTHALIRYTGWNGFSAVFGAGGAITLRSSMLSESSISGIDLNGIDADVRVEGCSFVGNGRYAVQEVAIDTLPGFVANSAEGNGLGNLILVTNTSPASDVSIGPENGIDDILVFAAPSTIVANRTLTLEAGLIVKWVVSSTSYFGVDGALNLLGTAFEPVVVTSIRDDDHGGDTNLDGSTPAGAGDWVGIIYTSSAGSSTGPSLLENALVRFPGWNGYAGLTCDSANVTARSVRIEHGSADGFHVSAHGGDALNWVAFANGQDGIELTGGSFDVVHATSARNGGRGIVSGAAYTGDLVSSIAWFSGLGNINGYTPSRVSHCDGSAGFAGSNGNINENPLFVDSSVDVGDLQLQLASPCVDAADPTVAMSVVKDHDEHSRMLDPTLSGALLPDMGAYEHHLWAMTVEGEPRLGRRLRFTVDGPDGSSIYLMGNLDGHSLLSPFGFITCGTASVQMLGMVEVGETYTLPLVADTSLAGTRFGVQTRTWPTGSPSLGAITNLYRSTLLAPAKKGARVAEAPGRSVVRELP